MLLIASPLLNITIHGILIKDLKINDNYLFNNDYLTTCQCWKTQKDIKVYFFNHLFDNKSI